MALSRTDVEASTDMPTNSCVLPQQPHDTETVTQVQQENAPTQQSSLSLQHFPKEILDDIIANVFGWETTVKVDKDNDGKYLRYGHKLEPKVLDPPALAIMGASRTLRSWVRQFLEDCQLILIESPKTNLLPIILAADVLLVCHGERARQFPKGFLAATHRIGKRGEKGRGLRFSGYPWGNDEEERKAFKKAEQTFLQPFIIRKQDLKRLCIGLQGADAGYLRFGKCTEHLIVFHADPIQSQDPAMSDGPVAEVTSVEKRRAERRECILDTYRENLTGFDKFQIQGTSSAEQFDEVAYPHVLSQSEILEDLQHRLDKGWHLLSLQKFGEAADTFVRGVQQIMWLDSRDILQGITSTIGSEVWLRLAPLSYELLISAARAFIAPISRCVRHSQESVNAGEDVGNTGVEEDSVTVAGESDAGESDAACSNNEESTAPKAVSPTKVSRDSGAQLSVVTSRPDLGAIRSELYPRIKNDEPKASKGLLRDEEMPESPPQNDVGVDIRGFQSSNVSNSDFEPDQRNEYTRTNDIELINWSQSLHRARIVLRRATGLQFGNLYVEPDSIQQAEIERLDLDIAFWEL